MKRFIVFGLIIIVMMVCPASALEISGVLDVDTLKFEDSPVSVTDNIILPENSRLVIMPGVRIEFAGAYNFVINGELHAVGDKDNWIVFTAEQQPDNPLESEDTLRWRGIRFIDAARDCQLMFCRIEYSWARGEWPENCGGGIFLNGSSPRITRCEIINNLADGEGGGVYGWFTSSVFQNNLVIRNRSERFGGGIFVAYANPQLMNNTISYNEANGWGGGIYVGSEGIPTVTNCIIVYNSENLRLGDDRLTLGDGYSADIARARSSEPVLSFCDVTPDHDEPFPGTANITAIPGFLDRPESEADQGPWDFHLIPRSPCIDTGDPQMNASSEPDMRINRVNIGAYGGTEEATLSLPVIYNREDSLGLSLTFGSERINTQSGEDITFENHGHYRLFIDSLVFSSPSFSPDSAENDTGGIVPAYSVAPVEIGEQLKFSILFEPTELRGYVDSVIVYSSDTSYVPVIRLTGTGINPIASLDPDVPYTDPVQSDTLIFGNQQIDEGRSLSIYVHNLVDDVQGSSDLRLTSTLVQADEFDIDFIDENGDPQNSLTVEPGDSAEVRVTFTPTRAEGYSEPVTIRTNDRSLVVTLEGRGIGPKMVIETDSLFMGYAYYDGDVLTDTVWIHNNGATGDNLDITNAIFTDPSAFSAILPPSEIASGDSAFLIVRFDPPAANQDFASDLTISGNYPLDYTFELVGRGMAEPGRYVFGHVTGIWAWSDDSPDYIVLDSVYVPAHQRLKIEAGARILFEPEAVFLADGEVRVAGTKTDSVHFLPRDQSGSQESRWDGMELNLNDVTRLSYCVVQKSRFGIQIRESSPIIEFCTISENGSEHPDTAVHDGGGVYMENSGTHLAGCLIENNIARYGGGVFILNSVPTITNCTIRSNESQQGGAIYLRFQASARIQSNLIYGNSATELGGGIVALEHSSPRILNNTIANNTGCGIYSAVRSVPALVNTIVWDNDSSIVLSNNGNVLVSYCDIEGGFVGTENLDEDPIFIGNGSFQLSNDSPLIDQGNPEDSHRDWYLPPSKGEDRNDIGAYGGPLGGAWELSDVGISVFQNPAFPHWLDIYVTALDTFDTTPTCGIELNNTDLEVNMTELDPRSYHGSHGFDDDGTLFIGVDAVINGNPLRMGRTFELAFVTMEEESMLSMAGGGLLIIPPSASNRSMTILTGVEPNPAKPTDKLLFISPVLSINGLETDGDHPAELSIKIETGVWTLDDQQKLGIYQMIESGWQRLEGGYDNGIVTGKIQRGGKFAVAWDETFSQSDNRHLPESADLLRAYPNPFNPSTTIEFSLAQSGEVKLVIYDLTGRCVSEVVKNVLASGRHTAVWDGRDNNGGSLPSGVYVARLEAVDVQRSIKLLLVR
ncbi:MAG: right-handed parallel beta-helix repeat-containing protein [Candidatus Electryoneaceae bacterium]|nr:right-handed parallel beta-helix repeat-containing protein [Candidatus Electryoneaceae bacterium]